MVGVEVAAGELVHIGAGIGGEIDGAEVERGQGLSGAGVAACWATDEEGTKRREAHARAAIRQRVRTGLGTVAIVAGASLMQGSPRR